MCRWKGRGKEGRERGAFVSSGRSQRVQGTLEKRCLVWMWIHYLEKEEVRMERYWGPDCGGLTQRPGRDLYFDSMVNVKSAMSICVQASRMPSELALGKLIWTWCVSCTQVEKPETRKTLWGKVYEVTNKSFSVTHYIPMVYFMTKAVPKLSFPLLLDAPTCRG